MKMVVPPFELGETYSGTDDSSNLINPHWLGQIHEFPLNNDSGSEVRGNCKRLTGRTIKAIAVRNESGLTLYGKRLARLTRTAGYSLLESVDGYCDTFAEKLCGVIDPGIATNGVADDDIFWLIIEGPTTILSPAAGAAFNGDIAVGAQLVGATAATTGTSVAGRVSNLVYTAATSGSTVAIQDALNQALNHIGYALSARTTGETSEDLLINACIKL